MFPTHNFLDLAVTIALLILAMILQRTSSSIMDTPRSQLYHETASFPNSNSTRELFSDVMDNSKENDFQRRLRDYVDGVANCSLPIPTSAEEKIYFSDMVWAQQQISIIEKEKAIVEKEKASVEKERESVLDLRASTHLKEVTAVTDQIRSLFAVMFGVAFIFASLNVGRGTDRVFQEIKDWMQSRFGKETYA